MRARVAVLCGLLTACTEDAGLYVELITDYVAPYEFTSVEVTTLRDGDSSASITSTPAGGSYEDGRRVAELEGLPRGTYWVTVGLLSGEVLVADRTLLVEHDGARVVAVLVPRSCAGVMCPGPGDPTATECFGGNCVPPECGPDHPEACGDPMCELDDECGPAMGCTTPMCKQGQCVQAADDTLCASGEWCHPELGCLEQAPDGGPPGVCTDQAAGAVCRAPVGMCDAEERCDGVSPDCPPDVLVPAGSRCRGSAGPCDVIETCDGMSKACPNDAFALPRTLCRASAAPCELDASCTGASADCPPNAIAPDGTDCDNTTCYGARCMMGSCRGGTACVGTDVCICDTICAPTGTACP